MSLQICRKRNGEGYITSVGCFREINGDWDTDIGTYIGNGNVLSYWFPFCRKGELYEITIVDPHSIYPIPHIEYHYQKLGELQPVCKECGQPIKKKVCKKCGQEVESE